MSTPITQPVKHPAKRREVPMPVIYAIGVLALVVSFATGYGTGIASADTPPRAAQGPVDFAREAHAPIDFAKHAQPVLVKMPEELP